MTDGVDWRWNLFLQRLGDAGWEPFVVDRLPYDRLATADFDLLVTWANHGLDHTYGAAGLIRLSHHGLSVEAMTSLGTPRDRLVMTANRLMTKASDNWRLADVIDSFVAGGGKDVACFERLLSIIPKQPAELAAISPDLLGDQELVEYLYTKRIKMAEYVEATKHCTRAEFHQMTEVGDGLDADTVELFIALVGASCTPTQAVKLSRGSIRTHDLVDLLDFGYSVDDFCQLAKRRASLSDINTFRAVQIPGIEDIIDTYDRSIPPSGLAGFHQMGVVDRSDMQWCIEQGLDGYNLEAWARIRVHHPMAVRDLQHFGVATYLVSRHCVRWWEHHDAQERDHQWQELGDRSFRIRSSGRFITLTPTTHGLVEPATGTVPPELGADQALVALGGRKSRLICVNELWWECMRSTGAPVKGLPAILDREMRTTASRLWMIDRLTEAVQAWPRTWQGRPPASPAG